MSRRKLGKNCLVSDSFDIVCLSKMPVLGPSCLLHHCAILFHRLYFSYNGGALAGTRESNSTLLSSQRLGVLTESYNATLVSKADSFQGATCFYEWFSDNLQRWVLDFSKISSYF